MHNREDSEARKQSIGFRVSRDGHAHIFGTIFGIETTALFFLKDMRSVSLRLALAPTKSDGEVAPAAHEVQKQPCKAPEKIRRTRENKDRPFAARRAGKSWVEARELRVFALCHEYPGPGALGLTAASYPWSLRARGRGLDAETVSGKAPGSESGSDRVGGVSF